MAIGDWLHGTYQSASHAVSSATETVSRKTGAVIDSAKASAHGLYDQGKATFTRVEQSVSTTARQVGDTVGAAVDGAKENAHKLYDRGKAGLSQVGDDLRDDSNVYGKLKYANPMYYTGKAAELAGEGVKMLGHGLNQGVEFLDNQSKNIPEPLKPQAGMVAGVLGFAGSLTEGVGSMASWAGRVTQGDTKTLEETGQTIKKVAEGAAYVDRKSRSAIGSAAEWVGEKTGSQTIKSAGQRYRELGEAEANLAGEDTKKVLDNVGQASVHYAAKAGEAEGGLVKWVGNKTGSRTLQDVGGQMQTNARTVADSNANGLTQGIDKVVDNRIKEYGENGSYAVSRDVTRVGAEIASLVVAPELLLSKAGKATKVAEGAEDLARLGRGAEELSGVASKTGKATEGATELARGTEQVSGAGKMTEGTGDLTRGTEQVSDASTKASQPTKLTEEAETTGPKSTRPAEEVKPPKIPKDTQADLDRIQQKFSEDTENLRGRMAELQKPSPEAAQKVQEADVAYQQAKAAFDAAPPGHEKGALNKAMKSARTRLSKANEAARGDLDEIGKLRNQLESKENVIRRIGEVELAPPNGLTLSKNQNWWDKKMGPQQEQAALAEHVANHRAEFGIPANASEAEATRIYLQKARDFATNPPEGTLMLKGAGEQPATIFYDPASRTLGVYQQVGDGMVPVTIHQLNAVSEKFPRGHYWGQGNDLAVFLDSR